MKRTTIIIILLFTSLNNSFRAQNSTDNGKSYIGDINKMFPAAPTSNNLMKFEEVPVSYYTGIPDINIPLFNFPTSNSAVSINIQLKYHPLNAKPDDRSGETGLGWSLIAGGTISRTVRGGNPDEKNRTVPLSSPPKTKYGIYNEVNNPTAKLINNENIDINDYAFNAAMGKYDTEYDLYQYNFAGNTGRFIVKKNSNGNYTTDKLDRNNLQIICNTDNTTGIINSFTIIDDKGVKYIFDAMEKSGKSTSSVKVGLITGTGGLNSTWETGDYYSAFHLTKINDQSDVNLAMFHYDLSSTVKFEETPTTTNRLASGVIYNNTVIGQPSPEGNMPGSYERQTTFSTSQTKLLTSIDLRGKGTVYFNYEAGRQDSNYTNSNELYKLKSVQVNIIGQGASNSYTDKYVLDYEYSNTNFQPVLGQPQTLKKMLLTQVTKISPNNGNSVYSLDYTSSNTLLHKDPWGYYKGGITTDVLKSMIYPTKGRVDFNFGENDYSYNSVADGSAMEEVTGEYVTQDYTIGVSFSEFNANYKEEFFTLDNPQTVNIHVDFGNLTYYNWTLTIYKKVGDQFIQVQQIPGYQQITCPTCPVSNPYPIDPDNPLVTEQDSYISLEAGTYYASLTKSGSGPNMPLSNYFGAHFTRTVFVEAINTNGDHSYSGGGLRINEITYYDSPATSSFVKKYLYDYHDITQAQKSSGALVFPKPIFHYNEIYSYKDKVYEPQITYSANFNTTTDYNILPVQKTQGADVGYKYITVKQIDNTGKTNGKTVYTYRSPIDYPNEAISAQMPVIPVPNYDYLRGQLVSEKKYDEDNRLLSESITSYTSTEYEKNDGIKIKDNFYNNVISEYYKYSGYSDFVSHFPGIILTTPYKNFEKFGMTLPVGKQETLYFYKNGVQSSVTISSNTVYNTNDYPSVITKSLTDGEIDITSYQYAHEKSNQRLIDANMIGIPLETSTVRKENTSDSGRITSKSEIRYDNLSNLYPSSVLSYDILNNGTSYTEVSYDKYDAFGNLQQYTTKNGVPVTIIWGYNQTQPIAKIEGAKFSDITQSLIDSIVNASNTDASALANNDETSFLTALDNFRKSSSLSQYQITTYTYDPLIGVRSITPPSGIRENYIYDSANRLEKIVDVNGKVLKEFKYNYKN
ncbi:hypothetical protein [Chryseobacterium gossypii]|uniref:hypothetical protein n=1 Tax=Chryseobacterium gossypii TaxID=3231602 RepID=UPI003524991E